MPAFPPSSSHAIRVRLLIAALLVVLLAGVQAVVSSSAEAATPGRVSRVGSQLVLDGQTWRFAGVNMYWLGRDDNVNDSEGATYPSHAKIDEGFAAASSLGATVVRSTSLGVSVGTPRSIEPRLGVFNDAAFDTIDYSIAAAARADIHLMIPLTDMWHYYHGGKHTFTSWRGYTDLPGQTPSTSSQQKEIEQHFYTDPRVIADFQEYIAYVLNHVNPYTGIRLGDDPTIAIWETGNEMWDAPPAWTAQTATFIKSLAPQALVADGSAATGKHVSEAALDAADVDILGGHFYPTDPAWAAADARLATQHSKAYIVGEFSLGPVGSPDPAAWLAGLAADPHVTGAMAWVLMPHLPDGTPEASGDGLGFHVPGATADEARQVAVFREAAPKFSSGGSPAPTPTAPAPSTGPVNLVSAAVASAATPGTFIGGSSGSGSASISTGQSPGGVTSVRATATTTGYTWVYPRIFSAGAAVVPGRTYTAGVAAHPAAGTAAGAMAAHLTWYDASGTWLGGADGPSATPVSGDWTSLAVTAVAPARAAWAVPQWQSSSPLVAGGAVELTSFGVWAGATVPPPSVPTPTPTPTPAPTPAGPINLIGSTGVVTGSPASLFTSGGSGGSGPTLVATQDSGASILRATATSSGYAWIYPRSHSSGAPVVPGTTYTASVAVRGAVLASAPSSGAAHLTWYDSSGAWLGGSDGPSGTLGSDWRTMSATAVAPSKAAWAIPQWQSTAGLAVGDRVELTSFGIAQGSTGPTTPIPSTTPAPTPTPTPTATPSPPPTPSSTPTATPSTTPTPTGGTPVPMGTNLLSAGVSASSPSSFAFGTPGGSAGMLSNGSDLNGAPSLRFTATSTALAWVYPRSHLDGAAVSPGLTYTASLRARPVSATTVRFAARLTWYDASGVYLGDTDGASRTPAGSEVVALSVTGTAPTRAAWATVRWQATTPLPAGSNIDLNGFSILRVVAKSP